MSNDMTNRANFEAEIEAVNVRAAIAKVETEVANAIAEIAKAKTETSNARTAIIEPEIERMLSLNPDLIKIINK